MSKAARFFRQGRIRKAKKRFMYILGHVDYALQWCEDGDIHDWLRMNRVWDTIMIQPLANRWKDWLNFYHSHLNPMMERLELLEGEYCVFVCVACAHCVLSDI